MDDSERHKRLSYVLQLLEDLRHFHQSNVHRCTCEICDKKSSLIYSSITKAIEEVGCITNSLVNPSLDRVDNKTFPKEGTVKIPEYSALVYDYNSGHSNKIEWSSPLLLGDGKYNSFHEQRVDESILTSIQNKTNNGKHTPDDHHVQHPSSAASQSLLSSTQKDSGVHCENLLHSHSISPIRSVADQNNLSENDCSVTSMLKPQKMTSSSSCQSSHNVCVKSVNEKKLSTDEDDKIAISEVSPGTEDQEYASTPATRTASSTSVTFTSPFQIPPIVCNQFGALSSSLNPAFGCDPSAFYPMPILPNIYPINFPKHPTPTNISFPHPSPHSINPQLIPHQLFSSLRNYDLSKAHSYAMPMTQLFSQIKINDNIEDLREEDVVSDKQITKLETEGEFVSGRCQASEMNCEEHSFNSSNKTSVEYDRPKSSSVVDYQSQDSVICTKNVMLSEAREMSDSLQVGQLKDISLNSSSSSQSCCSTNDSRSDVMWRPWEVKDDIYRIISDCSIEEEESWGKEVKYDDSDHFGDNEEEIDESYSFENASSCKSPCKRPLYKRKRNNLKFINTSDHPSEKCDSSSACKKSLFEEDSVCSKTSEVNVKTESDLFISAGINDIQNPLPRNRNRDISPPKSLLTESVVLFEEEIATTVNDSPKSGRKLKCGQALFTDLNCKENKNASNSCKSSTPKILLSGPPEEHLSSLNDISNKPFNSKNLSFGQAENDMFVKSGIEQKQTTPVKNEIVLNNCLNSIVGVESCEDFIDSEQRNKEQEIVLKRNLMNEKDLLEVYNSKESQSFSSVFRDGGHELSAIAQSATQICKKGHAATKTFPPNNKRREVVKSQPSASPNCQDRHRRVPMMGTLRRTTKLRRDVRSEDVSDWVRENGDEQKCYDKDREIINFCSKNDDRDDVFTHVNEEQCFEGKDLNHIDDKRLEWDVIVTAAPAWGAPALFHTESEGHEITVPKKPARKQMADSNLTPDSNRNSTDDTSMTLCNEPDTDLKRETVFNHLCEEKSEEYLYSQRQFETQTSIDRTCVTKGSKSEFGESPSSPVATSKQAGTESSLPHKNLCKQFLNLCIDKDAVNLNRSLPLLPGKVSQKLVMKGSNEDRVNTLESFEANQSFPKMTEVQRPDNLEAVALAARSVATQNLVLDLHQGLSTPMREKGLAPRNRRSIFGFSPPGVRSPPQGRNTPQTKKDGCPDSSTMSPDPHGKQDGPVDKFWSTFDVSSRFPQPPDLEEILFNCVTHCICVVDAGLQGKIVSVNEAFQLMVGIHEKILGLRLSRFIKVRPSPLDLAVSLPQKIILSDGSCTSVSGKLVSCMTAKSGEIPVSMWSVPVKSDQRSSLLVCVIAVTVPVSEDLYVDEDGELVFGDDDNSFHNGDGLTPCLSGSFTGLVVVQSNGCIVSHDEDFFRFYLGHENMELHRMSKLLMEVVRISTTGTTSISSLNSSSSQHSPVVCLQSSPSSRNQLLSSIGDVSCLKKFPARDDEFTGLLLPARCFLQASPEELIDDDADTDKSTDVEDEEEECGDGHEKSLDEMMKRNCFLHPQPQKLSLPTTSTPSKSQAVMNGRWKINKFDDDNCEMTNGIYAAKFCCGDGDHIDVTFKLGSIIVASGETLYCLWISIQENYENDDDSLAGDDDDFNDEDEDGTKSKHLSDGLVQGEETGNKLSGNDKCEEEEGSVTVDKECELRQKRLNQLQRELGMERKNPDISLGHLILDQAALNQSLNATAGEDVLDLEQAVVGSFVENYRILETLGQGSFGFVRRAFPIARDLNSVVVKFIKKSSMFEDGWQHQSSSVDVISVKEDKLNVPLEVAILQSLDQENIVKVLDVHQNDHFVQLVMEDFADLDLFDFIDQVNIDEDLACHIFKQIVKAVDYLHSKSILHRDIKDENVIINSSFHCKLIDFGSASYLLPPGQLFYKFRGTMEYCSPEVHLGRGYRGPELDAWALGVTLFTVVYRENPYAAECVPHQMTVNDLPFPVSGDLVNVIFGLLCCDPNQRFSVSKALASVWFRQEIDLTPYKWDEILGTGDLVEY